MSVDLIPPTVRTEVRRTAVLVSRHLFCPGRRADGDSIAGVDSNQSMDACYGVIAEG
jgi:hypothetical protein